MPVMLFKERFRGQFHFWRAPMFSRRALRLHRRKNFQAAQSAFVSSQS